MPGVGVKLYSVFFKLLLKQRLSNTGSSNNEGYGLIPLASNVSTPANAAFVDGVASKDVNIDPFTSLSLRIFLPQSALPNHSRAVFLGKIEHDEFGWDCHKNQLQLDVRSSDGHGYQGYVPSNTVSNHKKLPVMLQFHGGAFISGSKDTLANDIFCRRMAKACNVIVIAVGYRLAVEHKCPAAYEDGMEALNWLAKQANLAECSKSATHVPAGFMHKGSDSYKELVDSFGDSALEPWIAAHGDVTRYAVSCLLVSFIYHKMCEARIIIAALLMALILFCIWNLCFLVSFLCVKLEFIIIAALLITSTLNRL